MTPRSSQAIKARDIFVLDLDDTLYPERDYVISGFKALDTWAYTELKIEGFAKHCIRLFEQGERGTIFNQALEAVGMNASQERIQQLLNIYRNHTPVGLTLFPDAERFLNQKSKNIQLGLITDGYLEVQKLKFAALNIKPFFDAVVFSDALGREHWKPSTAPYEQVETLLKVEGTRCLYIGDNPTKDFLGARTRGWLTIRLRRESGEHCLKEPTAEHAADFEIHSLDELL